MLLILYTYHVIQLFDKFNYNYLYLPYIFIYIYFKQLIELFRNSNFINKKQNLSGELGQTICILIYFFIFNILCILFSFANKLSYLRYVILVNYDHFQILIFCIHKIHLKI